MDDDGVVAVEKKVPTKPPKPEYPKLIKCKFKYVGCERVVGSPSGELDYRAGCEIFRHPSTVPGNATLEREWLERRAQEAAVPLSRCERAALSGRRPAPTEKDGQRTKDGLQDYPGTVPDPAWEEKDRCKCDGVKWCEMCARRGYKEGSQGLPDHCIVGREDRDCIQARRAGLRARARRSTYVPSAEREAAGAAAWWTPVRHVGHVICSTTWTAMIACARAAVWLSDDLGPCGWWVMTLNLAAWAIALVRSASSSTQEAVTLAALALLTVFSLTTRSSTIASCFASGWPLTRLYRLAFWLRWRLTCWRSRASRTYDTQDALGSVDRLPDAYVPIIPHSSCSVYVPGDVDAVLDVKVVRPGWQHFTKQSGQSPTPSPGTADKPSIRRAIGSSQRSGSSFRFGS